MNNTSDMSAVRDAVLSQRFAARVRERISVANLRIIGADDPFGIRYECVLEAHGLVRIEPLCERHFQAFRDFYDGLDPEFGLSPQSRQAFDEHNTTDAALRGIVARVESREDARFVVMLSRFVVGYLLIEEIGCLQRREKTGSGEDEVAMIGMGVSDRLHGSGLADLAMLFLKLVGALAGVKLGLCARADNLRAQRFYVRHGFQRKGEKDIWVPHTGARTTEPWYVLPENECEELAAWPGADVTPCGGSAASAHPVPRAGGPVEKLGLCKPFRLCFGLLRALYPGWRLAPRRARGKADPGLFYEAPTGEAPGYRPLRGLRETAHTEDDSQAWHATA